MSFEQSLRLYLQDFFKTKDIVFDNFVSGGRISNVYTLIINAKYRIFVKEVDLAEQNLLLCEQKNLELLEGEFCPRTPRVITYFCDTKHAFLILEYIRQAPKKKKFYDVFAEQLAYLHTHKTQSLCGLSYNNFIGKTIQKNGNNTDWISFFSTERLLFQGELALKRGLFSSEDIIQLKKLCMQLASVIPHSGDFSLVHGDLWAGNHMSDENGMPIFFDPAVYYGDREVDIAMTELFGGYPTRFYEVYNYYAPLSSNYHEKKDVYNLYHLINHLNLFENSYYRECINIIKRYGGNKKTG